MSDLDKILKLSKKDIEALSYEDARAMLSTVVDGLDDSQLPLSDLMKLWEIGEQIATVCDGQLKAAAEKLNDGLPSEE
ncbi:MAG: Exonuclease small subunit [Actinomycetota bacterium]|jgi:exodeoxyribonuclease VII small subunit